MSKYRKTNLNKIFKISLMIMLFAASVNSAFGSPNSVPVCANVTSGHFRCMSEVIANAQGQPKMMTSPLVAIGYGPNDFLTAYSLGTGMVSTNKTIAIVDAYDQPNISSDLAVYSSQYGIPSLKQCSASPTSSSCFQKVDQTGGTSYPIYDPSWGLEISLDVEVAHAICQNCNILLVEANSNSYDDLMTAFDTAAAMGADVISNSYGSTEFSSETSFDSHFNLQGKAITFSSGDSGYNMSYPAASPYVTSVGGTTLQSISPRVETVWNGAGSGCSPYEPKPSFQNDTGCSKRTYADVSADADPNTGAVIYDSPYGGGGWWQVGGTSLSAPIIAGVYALGKGFSGYGNSMPYTNGKYGVNLYDITSGSNGICGGSYLCTAGPGYDGPTGLGSPIGTGAFETAGITDAISPNTTITLSGTLGNDSWFISDVKITLSASDNVGGSGVNKTEYNLNNTTWSTYITPFNITNEGITAVYYRSTDNAGNVEPTKNQTIKINKTVITNVTGDVNGDGKVTVADALLYLRSSVGQDTSPYHVDVSNDVTCDGKITVADALLVLRKSVGQNVSLVCSSP